jgi:hypothetical protein
MKNKDNQRNILLDAARAHVKHHARAYAPLPTYRNPLHQSNTKHPTSHNQSRHTLHKGKSTS